jgi:hypothetical protein
MSACATYCLQFNSSFTFAQAEAHRLQPICAECCLCIFRSSEVAN